MRIDELVAAATRQAEASGFFTRGNPRPVAEHVALLVTEIGELFEAHRDGFTPTEILFQGVRAASNELRSSPTDEDGTLLKPVGLATELADLVIRAANFAGEHGIDLEMAIQVKVAYNATRPRLHGRHS